MSLNGLMKKGNNCIEERENIPGAPLWHMGKVVILESKNSFNLLQNTIDLTGMGILLLIICRMKQTIMKISQVRGVTHNASLV